MKKHQNLAILLLSIFTLIADGSGNRTEAAPVAEKSATLATPAARAILDAMPPGAFRTTILRLEPAAQTRLLETLASHPIPAADHGSLQVTPDGGLIYACIFHPVTPDTGTAPASTEANAPPPPPAAPVPIDQPPVRHSRPGARYILFLDFGGMTITGTQWNTNYGTSIFVARPYDIDDSPATFNDQEQANIIQIWERVAEDYAPFDIDVTTEKPGRFTTTTGRVLITRSTDKNGNPMPSHEAGGVAWLDVFGNSNYVSTYSPAFAYYDHMGTGDRQTANIAEVASHEFGHNLGLHHDGHPSDGEYYKGHGIGATSWGTIMGAAYDCNLTQWSKGEYAGANNKEDDLAIIAEKIPYREETIGATIETASALTPAPDGTPGATGTLIHAGDAHVYQFRIPTPGDHYTFQAHPYRADTGSYGGNTDLRLELLDQDGNPLASDAPENETRATIDWTATDSGTYHLRITTTGLGTPENAPPGYTPYGSIGQYTIRTNLPMLPPEFTSPLTITTWINEPFTHTIEATGFPDTITVSGLPPGFHYDPQTRTITGHPATNGRITLSLTATNRIGSTTATLTITVTNAPPAITRDPAGREALVGDAVTFDAGVTGTPPLAFQWHHNGAPIPGATSPGLYLGGITPAHAGDYTVSVSNMTGHTAASLPARLLVIVPPAITAPPAGVTVQAGSPATLTAAIAGSPPPACRWQRKAYGGYTWDDLYDDAIYTGTGTPVLRITTAARGMSGDQFRLVLVTRTNTWESGQVISPPAFLNVTERPEPPRLLVQPQSLTLQAGRGITLTVSATGSPPPAYQWRKDGIPIPGANLPELTLNFMTPALQGGYDCVVTNTQGTVTSALATLAVEPVGATVAFVTSTLEQTYDGKPRVVETTATSTWAADGGAGLRRVITYNGSTTPPVNAGTYNVTVTLAEPGFKTTIDHATLIVRKAGQRITFSAAAAAQTTRWIYDPPFGLDQYAHSTSGLPLACSTSAPGVISVSGRLATIHSIGDALLTFTQPGDANHDAAPPATLALTVAARGTPAPESVRQACIGTSVTLPSSTDGAVGPGLRYYAKGLPKGLRIDPVTGLITGRITAKPGSYAITLWSKQGKVRTDLDSFVFTVTAFPAAFQGGFDGLLLDSNAAATQAIPFGRFELKITSTGSFTGKFLYRDGKTRSLRGVLQTTADGTGAGALVVSDKREGLMANIVFIEAGGRLLFYLSRNTTNEAETEDGRKRPIWSKKAPVPWQGIHATILVPVYPPTPADPAGSGSAILKIDATGKMTIKGTTADGAKLAGAIPASTGAVYFWYINPGKIAGASLGGEVYFGRKAGSIENPWHTGEDTESWLIWRRLPNTRAKNFPNGFGPILLTPETAQ